MSRYDPVEFCGTIKFKTEAAYLVYDGANDVWIPKSQVLDSHQIKGDDWEFVIPEWLAEEKGII